MHHKKLLSIIGIFIAAFIFLTACTTKDNAATTSSNTTTSESAINNAKQLLISSKEWKYNATNKVYYQVGIKYGTKTTSTKYESMGIFIPAAYVDAKSNGDGTYTLSLNDSGTVKGYTAKTAPIVMPINTPGYSAQAAPTGYESSSTSYTNAGFIYVAAGCRGMNQTDKTNGSSPWGVTDLKAAVRTLRLNASSLPGDTDRIFTFGHSGGGAQSSIMGSSGDSELYTKYLNSIGAPMVTTSGESTSDAIDGAMAWCPITNLDTANEAYEWNMGQFATTGTRKSGTFTKSLSNDMAVSFAKYINNLGLENSDGTKLTLKKSKSGIYQSGTYYTYLKKVVEQSLNNFLKDTTFPYKANTTSGPSGAAPQSGSNPSGSAKKGTKPSGSKKPSGKNSSKSSSGKTYKTVTAYIKSLNKNGTWVKYNSKTNTATITSLKAFAKHEKQASKDVGAFDGLTRQETENGLFGTSDRSKNHYDKIMNSLLKTNKTKYSKLKGYKSSYAKAFSADLKKTDSEGSSMQTRLNMYTPMYYLSSYYSGYNTTTVAKHWRIRTGLFQTDTALTTETNLALALKQNKNVSDVDFATVWGQGHTEAERTGNNVTNFIKWVNKSVTSE